FSDGLLSNQRRLAVAKKEDKFIPGGLAIDARGEALFVAGTWGNGVGIVPLGDPEKRVTVALEKESYPYACTVDPAGKRLYVSLWNLSSVAVIDLGEKKVVETWATEAHPTEMVLSPDGKLMYVACANSTKVSVLDTTQKGKAVETIACALYPTAPAGNTPNSLCLTPDGQVLFVANADANNLALFKVAEPGKSQSLGFIPVGWYPTSVRYNAADKRIYVANGKGLSSRANREGPGPDADRNLAPLYQYIGALLHGTLGIIDMPAPE